MMFMLGYSLVMLTLIAKDSLSQFVTLRNKEK